MKDNIIKYERNNCKLSRKKIDGTLIKDISNLFWLKKEKEAIRNKIIRDIRNIFEHEEEKYCKPEKVHNFWSNNYIEYESKEEYLNNILIKLDHT